VVIFLVISLCELHADSETKHLVSELLDLEQRAIRWYGTVATFYLKHLAGRFRNGTCLLLFIILEMNMNNSLFMIFATCRCIKANVRSRSCEIEGSSVCHAQVARLEMPQQKVLFLNHLINCDTSFFILFLKLWCYS
jgi:hypothetical protein